MAERSIGVLSDYFTGTVRDEDYDSAAYLVTTEPDGEHHAALVSVGELRVGLEGQTHVALRRESTTTGNLRRAGTGLLLFARPRAAVRARLVVRPLCSIDGGNAGPLILFGGQIVQADVDNAPYAEVVSGVRFVLCDEKSALARWRRTQQLISEAIVSLEDKV